jgi:hypothetical protein
MWLKQWAIRLNIGIGALVVIQDALKQAFIQNELFLSNRIKREGEGAIFF